MQRIEGTARLDRVAERLDRLSDRVVTPAVRGTLRGDRLGHALHPTMTDVPIGCWLSAMILDLTGERRGARRLTLAGVIAAAPTVATGLAEWRRIVDSRTRRVASLHAIGGTLTTALHAMSWWKRGRHPFKAIGWSLAGGAVAAATGWLGGHLAFVEGVGRGERAERPATLEDLRPETIATV